MRILTIIAFASLFFSCDNRELADYHSDHFNLVQLAEGVFACIHKFGGEAICNAGIIDNGEETIIFDTFLSPGVAEEFERIVVHYGLSPIGYVVNSHAHNDHIRGNQVFGKDIDIISTSRTAELIRLWESEGIPEEKEYAPAMLSYWDSIYYAFQGDTSSRAFKNILMWRPYYKVLAESHLRVKTRLPNLIMEDEMSLKGSARDVKLISLGAGHTESDMILYLPDDSIVFAADLVFNQMHPYMGHGFPEDWLDYLDYIQSLSFNHLVPGHGDIGGLETILAMKNYINNISDIASELISNQYPVDSIANTPVPDVYRQWWFENFYYSNLRFMYAHLQQVQSHGL